MSKKFNFSERVNNIFDANDTTAEEVVGLMKDLYSGDLKSGITKREAEDSLREFSRQFFGVAKDASKKEIKRARREHEREFYDLLEEVYEFVVSTGISDNEWFNQLVNYESLSATDDKMYTVKDTDVVLSVSRLGKRHHDTILQKLPGKKNFTIETDLYGLAVGADIDKYIVGQEDWSDLVNHVGAAIVNLRQELVMSALAGAVDQLPAKSQFVKTLAFTAANRQVINTLLEDVSVANDNAPVIIMGTAVGLQNFENLVNVNWIANSSKEQVATLGHLGNYGPYQLIEIPQKFVRNDVTRKVYDDDVLWVFAATGEDKLVEMIDVGEPLIDEITERGEADGRIDDTMKYELQVEIGCAARVGRYFGQITVDHD